MKEGEKITDHLNVFNTRICQLNSIDAKLDDGLEAVTLLCSLSESWEHLVTSFNFSTTETIGFGNVVGDLLSKEVRRKSSLETSTLEAIVVIDRSIERGKDLSKTSWNKLKGRKGKGKGRCWYCNKLGYLKKDCWKMK
jgi:hypothetical protein